MSGPMWIDPDEGWRYGFPKLWHGEGDLDVWLAEQGYPAGKHSPYFRMWYPSDDDVCAVQQNLSSPKG